MTPLTQWNPYNIEYIDRSLYTYSSGKCDQSPSQAYNGWTDDNFYFTPADFFNGIGTSGAGDTVSNNVCALDKNNVEHTVMASGHWITFPEIANGVGRVRQRYDVHIVFIHKHKNICFSFYYKDILYFQFIMVVIWHLKKLKHFKI